MASHIPVNHRLQPFYRFLAALAGLYVLVFGIVGVVRTSGSSFFDQTSDTSALGLRSNLAFAILSIVVGLIVFGAAVVGRNVDHFVNIVAGLVFLLAGMLMMTLLQTNANFLNFQISTCIVSFVIGIVLFTAGLYGKVGTAEDVDRQERHRLHHEHDTSRMWEERPAQSASANRPASA